MKSGVHIWMNKILKAALAYQKLGYAVIPLHSIKNKKCTCKQGAKCTAPGKHPRTENGLKDASRDINKITEWFEKHPESNIALATGVLNGFFVVDVDINEDIGKYGNETIEYLEQKFGKLPDTCEQITGAGGRHLLFKSPEYVINNRTGVAKWIDIKGENGYIVVSPSKHISENNYEWEVSSRLGEIEIAALPEKWLQFITGRNESEEKRQMIIGDVFPEGTRNESMFKIASSLHAKNYAYPEIKALMLETNKARCVPMLEDKELDTIINSVVDRYPAGNEYDKAKERHIKNNKKLVFDIGYCVFIEKTEKWKPKNIQENVERLLEYYEIQPKYNELTKNLDMEVPGRKFTKDNKEDLELQYIYNLCMKHDFTALSKDLIKSIILDLGDINKYHPGRDWLNTIYEQRKGSVGASGIIELEKLKNTLITGTFDENIKHMLITKWLISCVEAVFSENGIASQGILTLQGAQGDGKTTWFKNLFPKGLGWFKEGLTLNPDNKDSVSVALSYWVCELGEMESTFKKDLDALKAFITNPTDVLRRPYARGMSNYPRRTIFCGTVNGEEFLKDPTGNRRFWVIPIFDLDLDTKINIEALWS